VEPVVGDRRFGDDPARQVDPHREAPLELQAHRSQLKRLVSALH
jgi:hypothetical protein